MSTASVSPTAHYTGYVWARNGLSHPELTTDEGRLLFHALQPAVLAASALGAPTLERFLLARHETIDARLTAAIEGGRVGQVVEIAAGMSPRGWRFASRYGDRLAYVEADLPGMAERKRRALERMGSLGANHRVVELDATAAAGPRSLRALARTLDAGRGLAVVTEGLLADLDAPAVASLWRAVARALGRFPDGVYLADDLLRSEVPQPAGAAFALALSAFVRSPVRLHFADEDEEVGALRRAGFGSVTLHRPDDGVVRVIEAALG